ncbi:hypothetical protein [Comamonas sp. A7-5]|uniref:hypothetical protein n=1 Tax=Comamonas sp. A7-5 TaxID=673549 RepID=UPI0031D3FC38
MSIADHAMNAIYGGFAGLIGALIGLYFKKKILKEQEKNKMLQAELDKANAVISELRRIVQTERGK